MNRSELVNNVSLNDKCPICNETKIKTINKIESRLDDFKDIFDLNLCEICNHRFISKFPNESFLNKLYKNASPYVIGQYEEKKIRKKEFIDKGFNEVVPYKKHWILEFINLDQKGSYFEVGPGLCNLYKIFVDNNWKCEGLELQEWINGPGIVHKFEEVNKEEKDLIVMLDVLEHTIDPIAFIKKLSDYQKINGMLFLTFPNGDSYKSKILGAKWPMVHPLSHLHFFSKKSIELVLKKNGYESILVKPYSLIEIYRHTRNFPKLIFKCLRDLLSFNFRSSFNRICEYIMGILDLINGDQMKVVAKKIK